MTPTGRDNGLPPAARYVALVDVDPPVADHVLALLREAGVTAVAEPFAGERDPYTLATKPHPRPTERVHVDVEHVALARAVVAQALPALTADFHAGAAMAQDAEAAEDAERDRLAREQLGSDEVDAMFADIVAGWSETSADPVPRWSVSEDAPAEDTPTDGDDDGKAGTRPPLSSRLVRRSGPAKPPPPVEDDEDHFVPPPPPPLPEADRVTRLAWAALIGGPTLIVLAALLGVQLEGWLAMLALAAFLGGFGTLVARMRDRPRQDDGWDDGAVL